MNRNRPGTPYDWLFIMFETWQGVGERERGRERKEQTEKAKEASLFASSEFLLPSSLSHLLSR